MTEAHEEKLTLTVDVNTPAHADRTTTPLFTKTRQQLIAREGGRCWICGRTEAEAGHPLEAHHHPVERSMAEMIDFKLVAADAKAGHLGPYAAAFDWDSFFDKGDVYLFVDDMTVNGLLLCKDHHIGKNEGLHFMPWPYMLAQRYGREGYQFTPSETIHHDVAADLALGALSQGS